MAQMNVFSQVQLNKPKQSRFDLSHEVKMSFKMGKITPILCEEIVPGDRIQVQPNIMIRLAPMLAPVMHRVRVRTDFFFVPNRLLWADFGKWITGDLDVQHPYASIDDAAKIFTQGSPADYLGYPTIGTNGDTVNYNPMPLAAYLLIYDEYYRDQNLISPVFVPLIAGDNNADYAPDTYSPVLKSRCWQHDYFTSCLPFAQKGDDVLLPLTIQDDIPVEFITGHNPLLRLPGSGAADPDDGTLEVNGGQLWNTVGNQNTALDPNGSLVVDVQSEAVTINTLRRAFRLQEFLERSARGGTRYVEWLLSMFGVRSSDSRLQRPEYLGGTIQNVVFSEVLATAQETTEEIPVGQMAGHGISVGGGNTISLRHAEEHGWMIGLISVLPDTAYQDGLPREFTRFDRFEYVNPIFANIGEQEVLNKEVAINHTLPEGIFGYNPRWSEKRFKNSRVSGDFKTTQSFWHMGRQFAGDPELNGDFVTADPTTRIFAFEDLNADNLYAQIYMKMSAVRKLPRFGIPTI